MPGRYSEGLRNGSRFLLAYKWKESRPCVVYTFAAGISIDLTIYPPQFSRVLLVLLEMNVRQRPTQRRK